MRSAMILAVMAFGTVLSAPATVQLFDAHLDVNKNDLHLFEQFKSYTQLHGKQYESKEHVLQRFSVFKSNLHTAQMYQEQDQGGARFGETQFMDLTPIEFANMMLPSMDKLKNDYPEAPDCKPKETQTELPEAFDWRDHQGVVSEVKNQGPCGSCWAFSVVANIEGQWQLKKNQTVILSEQELMDCDKLDGACNGGLPVYAYEEIERLGGLESESAYPYTPHQKKCSLQKKEIVAEIDAFCELNTQKDEETIKKYLVEHGPLSVAINANPLQFYYGGIHHPYKLMCPPKRLNHAVLLVGYGQEDNKPYWILKNSWGTRWGEKGFFRMFRGDNVCGISEMVTTAIIKS